MATDPGHGPSTRATRRTRGTRRGLRRKAAALLLSAILIFGIVVYRPAPAAACSLFNPLCWVEEALDIIQDLVEGVAMLVLDVIQLNPGEFFDDLTDIAEDFIACDGLGIPQVTYVEFLVYQEGADVAQHLFDDCDASEEIDPAVRAKLATYFRSDLSSVRIHKNCDFDVGGRAAITFGENIFFKTGQYHPSCTGPDSCSCRGGIDTTGFALLSHELIHVMQYRREGFKDFICMYALECGAGSLIDLKCPFEQQAYIYQALVLEDMKRDGDGAFTCPLGECDDDVREWNAGNIDEHSCVSEIQLCGLTSGDPNAPDYCEANDNCPDTFNPGQEDSDGDGRGDACDVDCPGDPDPRPFEDLDNDCVFDNVDNCPCPQSTIDLLTDCDSSTSPPPSGPQTGCYPSSGCFDYANSDQADNDGDGMGDLCDPDDDNDTLSDVDETNLYGTDPFKADTDDDGLLDPQEVFDACLDALDPDTDGDGLTDGQEVLTYGTNPCVADSDGDGLSDGDEVLVHGTDPLDPDTDDDLLEDGVEVDTGTDPLNPDSDGDGIIDGKDVEFLQNAIDALPQSAFRDAGGGTRQALLRALENSEHRIDRDRIDAALRRLRQAREHLDGCGTTADNNDWIVDCAAQLQIRALLDLLIANLQM